MKYRIVFAPGCFDLFHAGHCSLLSRARDLGTYLIVGLNSDESVRMLKGTGRPVWSYERRAAAIRATSVVDAIVTIRGLTPRDVLAELCPDVLVKGAGSPPTDGMEFAGETVYLALAHGLSTTSIIESLRNVG